MRYLHPVQAHERFVSSGCYRFAKDGETLAKTESWVMHGHADGERFVRVDLDARAEEGKSVLAEALLDRDRSLARLDLRYENARFDGGIKDLRASYQLANGRLHIGYTLNGAERDYREIALPPRTLIDIPLLAFRGQTIEAMAMNERASLPIFVPMFEHAQLFPGTTQLIAPPVEFAGEDVVSLGRQRIHTRRYRYKDKAASYWIDAQGVILRRVNAFRQSEMVVQISDYAASAETGA